MLHHLDTAIAFAVILTALSLLVTVLTQIVSNLLGLRGAQLRWGLETLIRATDASLDKHAREIAQQVLQHPLISDSALSSRPSLLSGLRGLLTGRWRLANGIRKEELLHILNLLAKAVDHSKAPADDDWKEALGRALETLTPRAQERIKTAQPHLEMLRAIDPGIAANALEAMTSSSSRALGEIERWFDSVMDRASQRFTLYARISTIVFSAVLAFALHLDAFALYTRLSANPEMRARVLASAAVIEQKAADILPQSTNASPAASTAAMRSLLAAHTNELNSVSPPPTLETPEKGRAWLKEKLDKAGIAHSEPWLEKYNGLVAEAALREKAEQLWSLVNDKLATELIPNPYPVPFYQGWWPPTAKFWGILASAALLSLGAPFWFNMLKNLSSLRPIVAGKMKAESQPPPAKD